MAASSWIRSINSTMQYIRKNYGVELYLTSHSLRIGFVTRLLSQVDIGKASEMIVHKSIQTTAKYNRYMTSNEKRKQISDIALNINSKTLEE